MTSSGVNHLPCSCCQDRVQSISLP